MPPRIVWTTAAKNDLAANCCRLVPPVPHGETELAIARDLQRALCDETDVIVVRVYSGFRIRRDEYVLLLDTGHGDWIIKLAVPARLQAEYDALISATRIGFDGNQVFARMIPLPNGKEPLALRYQTAESRIDLPNTKTLSDAFLSSVDYRYPTPESMGEVLRLLLDSVGSECYRAAGPRSLLDADRRDIRLNPAANGGGHHYLSEALLPWTEGDPLEVRRNAIAAFPIRRDQPIFIDPVRMFQEIIDEIAASSARLDALVPSALVGSAHGDLHGLNVRVGIEDNAASRPSLFDYENMSPDNLVAWDFVKLETELKIRSYDRIWSRLKVRPYAWTIGRFESQLAQRTELHRHDNCWPTGGGSDPESRLQSLILCIRGAAARWLGRGRPDNWLHEYYFVLATYGVYTVRYPNQSTRERMAAFVSAGVAAARYAWSLDRSNRSPPPRERLRTVWQLNRSGRSAEARAMAQGIRDAMRDDLRAWFELANAQLKSHDRAGAIQTLEEANECFRGNLDEDTFSLWGRWYKDAGDEARHAGEFPGASAGDRRQALVAADANYANAFKYYEHAYALNKDRFPGVNLATMALMRAAMAKKLGYPEFASFIALARDMAREIEATHREGLWQAKLDDDEIWMPATLGEALLINEEWLRASDAYQRALHQPGFQPDFARAMLAQVNRVLDAYKELGIVPQGPLADPELFFKPVLELR